MAHGYSGQGGAPEKRTSYYGEDVIYLPAEDKIQIGSEFYDTGELNVSLSRRGDPLTLNGEEYRDLGEVKERLSKGGEQ